MKIEVSRDSKGLGAVKNKKKMQMQLNCIEC